MGLHAEPAMETSQTLAALYRAQEDRSLHQPVTAIWLALGGGFAIFAGEIATWLMLNYIILDYGLGQAAQIFFIYFTYAIIGIGQFFIAMITDHYLGLVRSIRLGLLLGLVAILGLVAVGQKGKPHLDYAGKRYEVQIVQENKTTIFKAVVDGVPHSFQVLNSGVLQFDSGYKGALPAKIPAGHWRTHMGDGTGSKIALLLFYALLVVSRSFGLSIVLSMMGRIYKEAQHARTLGFMVAAIGMNISFLQILLEQIYVEPKFGYRISLLISASVLFAIYLYVLNSRRVRRIPGAVYTLASVPRRRRALLCIVLCYVATAALLIAALFAIAPAPSGMPVSTHFITKLFNIMLGSLLGLWLLVVGVGLLHSYFLAQRSVFFATLAMPLWSLLIVMFWSTINSGQTYMALLTEAHVAIGHSAFAQFIVQHSAIVDALMVCLLGAVFVLIWPKLRDSYGANWPTIFPMTRVIAAFFLACVCYYLLSFGAFQAQGQAYMAWPYYATAISLLPIAELIFTPIMNSVVFYLWRDHRPTVALAFLSCSNRMTALFTDYVHRFTGLDAYAPHKIGTGADALPRIGEAFLILGGIGAGCGVIIMAFLSPLFIYIFRSYMKARAQEGH